MTTTEPTLRASLIEMRGIMNRVQYESRRAIERNDSAVIYATVSSTAREMDRLIVLWRRAARQLGVEY